jgi:hypothetical protein
VDFANRTPTTLFFFIVLKMDSRLESSRSTGTVPATHLVPAVSPHTSPGIAASAVWSIGSGAANATRAAARAVDIQILRSTAPFPMAVFHGCVSRLERVPHCAVAVVAPGPQ